MKKACVLVVDDDPDVRELLLFMLKVKGYDVMAAADGKAALDAIEQQCPSLVVTDVMMPEMDGEQLIREVRARKGCADLPIVAMSAYGDWLAKAYISGATETVRKPCDPLDLLDVISRLLPDDGLGH